MCGWLFGPSLQSDAFITFSQQGPFPPSLIGSQEHEISGSATHVPGHGVPTVHPPTVATLQKPGTDAGVTLQENPPPAGAHSNKEPQVVGQLWPPNGLGSHTVPKPAKTIFALRSAQATTIKILNFISTSFQILLIQSEYAMPEPFRHGSFANVHP